MEENQNVKNLERLDVKSQDGCQLNIEALRQIAPSCFTEVKEGGKIKKVVDFDILRQLLGDDTVEDTHERYEFTWPGKREARAEAARSIDKTLRPVVEDSVDWDTTQNLYIEGDNLEALKLLQKSYLGKIKMIYIDPPYNTGNDFVYDDDFEISKEKYDEQQGNIDEFGNRYRRNLDSNGRYHSDWCSMIYSRLLISRTLLAEDGIICISIDDHEQDNMKKICSEIFGDSNFITVFPRVTKRGGKSTGTYAQNHDYVLCFVKNAKCATIQGVNHIDSGFSNEDEFVEERGPYKLNQALDYNSLQYNKTMDFEIILDGISYVPGGDKEKQIERHNGKHSTHDWVWRWSKKKFDFGLKNGWIEISKKGRIYTKTYLNATIEKNGEGEYYINYKERTKPISTLELVDNKYSNDNSSKDFKKLMGASYFDYVKPVNLITMFLKTATNKDSVILDFFSGSATTAHSVLSLNAEDGGHRLFIMVQIPEKIEEGSTAFNAGYKNICEIGKERIRRAGKKVKEEAGDKANDLDIGFRVFRIDSSNFGEEINMKPSDYDQSQLDLFANNIKSDRTDLDLLFGAMLNWGVELTMPMKSEKVDGKDIYVVNDGDLVACFAENVTDNIIKAMAEKMPLRVLFRDSCFDTDTKKLNLFEKFKQICDWSEDESINNIRVI